MSILAFLCVGLASASPPAPPSASVMMVPSTVEARPGAAERSNLRIANTGSAPLTVTAIRFVQEGTPFSLYGLYPSFTVPAGRLAVIDVLFAPTAPGTASVTAIVTTSAGEFSATLTGKADPALEDIGLYGPQSFTVIGALMDPLTPLVPPRP